MSFKGSTEVEFNKYISENKNKKGLYPWSKDRVFIEGAELNRGVDFLKRVAGVQVTMPSHAVGQDRTTIKAQVAIIKAMFGCQLPMLMLQIRCLTGL